MRIREFYETTIRHFPATERLQLATLILRDLVDSSEAAVDVRDDWSDKDMAELAAASLSHGMITTVTHDDASHQ